MKNGRLDAAYYAPNVRELDTVLEQIQYPLKPLGTLLLHPPMNGFDARDYQEVGNPYLRVSNVRPFEVVADDIKFVSPEVMKDVKARNVSLKTNDVLLTRKGSFGVATVVPEAAKDYLISSEIILLRLSPLANCSAEYLAAWLNSATAQQLLDRSKTGGIMGHITQEVVSSFPIPLPPLDIQRELVTELEAARAQRRVKLARADVLLAGIDAWLLERLGLTPTPENKRVCFGVKLGTLMKSQGRLDVKAYEPSSQATAHHQRVLLGELVRRSQQRLDKAEVRREDYITLSTDGTIKPKLIKEWREVEGDELFKAQMFLAQRGQVVFSKIDLRNGAIAIVDKDRIAVTAEFPVYDVDATRLNADFLALLLRSTYFRDFMNSLSSGHSGRKRVHPSQFEEFLIPLPSLEEQQTITAEVQARRAAARRLREEVESEWSAAKAQFEAQLLRGGDAA